MSPLPNRRRFTLCSGHPAHAAGTATAESGGPYPTLRVTAMNRMLFFSRILTFHQRTAKTIQLPYGKAVNFSCFGVGYETIQRGAARFCVTTHVLADLRNLPPLAFGIPRRVRRLVVHSAGRRIRAYPHGRGPSNEGAGRESGDPNCLIPTGRSRPSGWAEAESSKMRPRRGAKNAFSKTAAEVVKAGSRRRLGNRPQLGQFKAWLCLRFSGRRRATSTLPTARVRSFQEFPVALRSIARF